MIILIISISWDTIELDEPTTGQDRGHLNKFLARMKMLNEAGKTIILISHDMGVVAEYARRTIVMKDGGDIDGCQYQRGVFPAGYS